MNTSNGLEILQEPVRQFAQARARRTYEALVQAAGVLFDERGFDATQTPDIAARAGVSVGTFYRYFTDKRQVYLEIMRLELAEAYHAVMDGLTPERFAGQARKDTLKDALRILLEHVTLSPKRHRVFLEMSLRDPEVFALKAAFDSEARKRLTVLCAAVCHLDEVPDPEATAYMVYTSVIECANHIAGLRGEFSMDRTRAMAALTELVLRTLFGSVS